MYNAEVPTGTAGLQGALTITGTFAFDVPPCTAAPAAPTSNTHVVGVNNITWKWNVIQEATSYRYNTVNDSTISGGAVKTTNLQFSQSGLTGNTEYTLYVWAESDCGISENPVSLTQTTDCKTSTITFAQEPISKTFSEGSYTQVATTNSTGAVLYTSSDESVATVDDSGVVTFQGVGTTDITASLAVNGEYCAADSKQYTLTIDCNSPFGDYSAGTITRPFTDGTYSRPVIDIESNFAASGTVSYESSNENIATVSAEGLVTFLSLGTVTVSAKTDAISYFCAKETSYVLTITCPAPTNFSYSAVTATSATVSWTGEAGAEYKVEYKKASETGYTLFAASQTDTFANLSSLEPETFYNIRITTLCGATGVSTVLEGSCFPTACEPYSVPFTENFESYSATAHDAVGIVPPCWYSYSTNTNSSYAYYTPHITFTDKFGFSPHSGSRSVGFMGRSSYSARYAYLVLPEFNVPISDLLLDFYYKYENIDNGTLTVGYITGVKNNFASYKALFTPLKTVTITQTPVYNFETAPADATYIVIRWDCNSSSWYSASIDDINVKECITHSVTFNDRGVENTVWQPNSCKDAISAPETPSVFCDEYEYEFSHWATSPNSRVAVKFPFVPYDNTVLHAVYTEKVETLFSDSFDDVCGDGRSSIGSRSGWSSISSCFPITNCGVIKLASTSNPGTIRKTAMNFEGTKILTLSFKALSWGSDGSTLSLSTSGGGTLSQSSIVPNSCSDDASPVFGPSDSYSITVTGATSNTTITFSAIAGKRVFLDDIVIADYTYSSAPPCLTVPPEEEEILITVNRAVNETFKTGEFIISGENLDAEEMVIVEIESDDGDYFEISADNGETFDNEDIFYAVVPKTIIIKYSPPEDAEGEEHNATIRVTYGNIEKTIHVRGQVVNVTTGIGKLLSGETVLRAEYFNLNGQKLGETSDNLPNGAYIVRKYTDKNRIIVEKLIIHTR
jgi:hypothetical protein